MKRKISCVISLIVLSFTCIRASIIQQDLRVLIDKSSELEKTGQLDSVLILEDSIRYIINNQTPLDTVELSDSYYRSGRVCVAKNDFEQAKSFIEKAVGLRRTLGERSEEYAASLAIFSLCLIASEEYQEAYEVSEKAINIYVNLNTNEDPLYAIALWTNFKSSSFLLPDDTDLCINKCSKAIEVYFNLAQSSLNESNYSLAIDCYKILLDLDLYINQPNGNMQLPYLMDIIYCHQEIGDLGQNLLYIEEAIDRWEAQDISPDQDYFSLTSIIGYYSLESQQYSKSVQYYEKALDASKILGIENPTIYADLSICYRMLGNYDKAHNCALLAVEIAAKNEPENKTALAYFECILAEAYQKLNKFNEAISYYEQNLDIENGFAYEYSQSHWIDFMNNLAVCYEKINRYDKCVEKYKLALQIAQKHGYISGIVMLCKNLANIYHKLDQYNESEEIINLGLETIKNSQINKDYANLHLTHISNLIAVGKYSESIDLSKELINKIQEIYGGDEVLLSSTYSYLGDANYGIGKLEESKKWYEKSHELTAKIYGESHYDNAPSLTRLGDVLTQMGNYQEALEMYNKASSVLEPMGPSYNLGVLFNNKGNVYHSLSNYNLAIENYLRALEIYKSINLEENIEYARTCLNLSNIYLYLDQFENALNYCQQGKQILNALFSDTDPEFYRVVFIEANIAAFTEPQEAVLIYEDFLNRINVEDFDSRSLINLFGELSRLYDQLDRHNEALAMARKQYELINDLNGDNPSYNKILAFKNLSKCYWNLNEYKTALIYAEDACSIAKEYYKENKKINADVISNLAFIYAALGDYEQAEEINRESVEIYSKIFGNNNTFTQSALCDQAYYMGENGNIDGAIDIIENVLHFCINGEHYNLNGHICALTDLSCYNLRNGNYEKAYEYAEEALNVVQNNKDVGESVLISIFTNLATSLYYMGYEQDALDLATRTVEIARNIFGEYSENYASALRIKALFGIDVSREQSQTAALECSLRLTDWLCNNFLFSTRKERNNLWNQHKDWFENQSNRLAKLIGTSEMIENGLNNSLFAKALLLKSDNELDKIIRHAESPEIKNLIEELSNIRKQTINSQELTKEQLDSLNLIAADKERTLLEECKQYGDFTQSLRVKWRDLKNCVNDGSVAVEFVTFKEPNNPSLIHYMAYAFDRSCDTPILIELFDNSILDKIKSTCYEDTELSQLIWGKIESNFPSVIKNIYFSAAGDLHTIGIETLLDWEKPEQTIAGRINFYRLSNLSTLIYGNKNNRITNGYIFGGIDYDIEINEPVFNNLTSDLSKTSLKLEVSGVKPLSGTLEEATSIHHSMTKRNVESSLIIGGDATEVSFRNLSNSDVSFIHVATHGYYMEADDYENSGLMYINPLKESLSSVDHALSRSGLLFAGANNTILHGTLNSLNDGILSGQDIAMLNFENLEFIVLSACQTGLGEISGEGVSGLQRGFKRAGAKSILMSLWEVNDKATQMLMTKFYEELLSGKSKFESLKLAQDYVRNYEEESEVDLNANLTATQRRQMERRGEKTEPKIVKQIIKPFDDPKYWAAFILLDALN